jgi:hypothetical protein
MPAKTIFGRFGPLLENQDDKRLWGPLLTVTLIDRQSVGKQSDRPNVIADDLRGLVDTGAQNSAIDVDLAKRLNLPVSRTGNLNMLGQLAPSNGYYFTLYFRDIGTAYMTEGPGQPFISSGSGFDLVIGWDVLQHFTLHISRRSEQVFLQYEE